MTLFTGLVCYSPLRPSQTIAQSALCVSSVLLFLDCKGKRGSMSEKLVKDLSYEAHLRMDMLLLPSNSGRDWKTLADKMGYSHEEILYFESQTQRSPVMELISNYESKGKTISELKSLLEEMERDDLIEDLEDYTGKRREV